MPTSEPGKTAAGSRHSYRPPRPGAGGTRTWAIAVVCALVVLAVVLLVAG